MRQPSILGVRLSKKDAPHAAMVHSLSLCLGERQDPGLASRGPEGAQGPSGTRKGPDLNHPLRDVPPPQVGVHRLEGCKAHPFRTLHKPNG